MDATEVVERLLSESNRTPVAVLATHGHLDHVADAHTVADAYGIPVWIHPADRHLLSARDGSVRVRDAAGTVRRTRMGRRRLVRLRGPAVDRPARAGSHAGQRAAAR